MDRIKERNSVEHGWGTLSSQGWANLTSQGTQGSLRGSPHSTLNSHSSGSLSSGSHVIPARLYYRNPRRIIEGTKQGSKKLALFTNFEITVTFKDSVRTFIVKGNETSEEVVKMVLQAFGVDGEPWTYLLRIAGGREEYLDLTDCSLNQYEYILDCLTQGRPIRLAVVDRSTAGLAPGSEDNELISPEQVRHRYADI